MTCRPNCGACCIAISISTPTSGQPNGKVAGSPCVHLKNDYSCGIYSVRPAVCRDFTPSEEFCGQNQQEALKLLHNLEVLTAPPSQTGLKPR